MALYTGAAGEDSMNVLLVHSPSHSRSCCQGLSAVHTEMQSPRQQLSGSMVPGRWLGQETFCIGTLPEELDGPGGQCIPVILELRVLRQGDHKLETIWATQSQSKIKAGHGGVSL